jgi:hypothetical protein
MAHKYDVIAKNGTYKTQDGTEKTRWLKMGACFETSNGLAVKIDSVPINWDGWMTLAQPKEKSNFQEAGASDYVARSAKSYADKTLDTIESDTPF